MVSLKNTALYNIADSMTIPLKMGEDEKLHYIVVQVSLSLNKKSKDFKTYGEGDLSGTEAMIQSAIIDVFGQYTVDEARDNQEAVKKAILQRLQAIYDSDFIYNVSFRDIKYS